MCPCALSTCVGKPRSRKNKPIWSKVWFSRAFVLNGSGLPGWGEKGRDGGDLFAGPNTKSYAAKWMGSPDNRFEVAEGVSPITYVRAGLPPTLTIRGDADPTVPYQHAIDLHEKLDEVSVPNELHTVPNGRHGGLNRELTLAIFETIQRLLLQHGFGGNMTAAP